MRVRFVDVGNRFKFEPGTLGAGKDFSFKIRKGGFWTAAEARVKLESSGVEIRPVKGELIVNDQPVQVSAKRGRSIRCACGRMTARPPRGGISMPLRPTSGRGRTWRQRWV